MVASDVQESPEIQFDQSPCSVVLPFSFGLMVYHIKAPNHLSCLTILNRLQNESKIRLVEGSSSFQITNQSSICSPFSSFSQPPVLGRPELSSGFVPGKDSELGRGRPRCFSGLGFATGGDLNKNM